MKTEASILDLLLDMSSVDPSDPNISSRPQAPRSKNFLRLILLVLSHDSCEENEFFFVKIGARVLN